MFFSDQHLCHVDVLHPLQVRARIEVAVLNFLKILNSSTLAISCLFVFCVRAAAKTTRTHSGNWKDWKVAILPVVQKQHQVLVTLLLRHACTMETHFIEILDMMHGSSRSKKQYAHS
ncbi:Meiotic recombination protein SPO11-2 [Camellia lanceoleosa]|uniref:Meiotic recombination protein SPO11-2 n=1 Tax=Camellia lanceoleosa TaxID=1840588 RepID=A0ACC0FET8_9ERIC|nr:Meiotic recombination protein SPO11-2 [Camellia lanceoleosa]